MTLPERQRKSVTGRFGTLHVSPLKKQDKRKTSTIVTRLGHNVKLQSLRQKMATILAGKPPLACTSTLDPLPEPEWEEVDMEVNDEDPPSTPANISQSQGTLTAEATTRRLLPSSSDHTYFDRWKKVMPSLVDPLISYIVSTNGQTLVPNLKGEIRSSCDNEFCARHTCQVLCLLLDRKLFPPFVLDQSSDFI